MVTIWWILPVLLGIICSLESFQLFMALFVIGWWNYLEGI